MMPLPEAITAARKALKLSQKRLAELAGIQRRQLATLESGGNVTLNTLRKVLAHLPNLESFTFDAVRVKVDDELTSDEQKYLEELADLSASVKGFAEQLDRRIHQRPRNRAELEEVIRRGEQLRSLPSDPLEIDAQTLETFTREIRETTERSIREVRVRALRFFSGRLAHRRKS